MRGDLTKADVVVALRAFGRLDARLVSVDVLDGIAHVVVRTDHRGGQIGLDELIDLATRLGLPARNFTFWDVPTNAIEVIIDLEPATPINRPLHRPATKD